MSEMVGRTPVRAEPLYLQPAIIEITCGENSGEVLGRAQPPAKDDS